MFKIKFKTFLIAAFGSILACLLCVNLITENFIGYADDIEHISVDKKITCTATLDDNFADDSVLVVLDSKISGINKVHNVNYFKGLEINKIVDLTVREKNFTIEEGEFKQILQIYLKNSSKENVLKSIAQLKKLEGVYSAEPNYFVEPAMIPNDHYYSNGRQWNLKATSGINMEGAWDCTQGSKNIRVGIIDTGIANHADLGNNLVAGYDFYNDNSITADDIEGHGTQVAGIIGAQGNNNKTGVAGINWEVSLVPLQCSFETSDNKYFIDTESVIKAINWATDKWGTSDQIDILNYSVAGFGTDIAVLEAVKGYKGLFVWAAGNFSENVDAFTNIDKFDIDNIISVGAIDKNNERSVWSSGASSAYGDRVNIFAPGGECDVTVIDGRNVPTTNNRGEYSAFYGTSCAAPHVAGVAALLLSICPDLNTAQLKNIILDTADRINITVPTSSGGTTTQSVKKLNAYSAVSKLKNAMDSNKSKTFYFVVDLVHSAQPYATTIDKPVMSFNNTYSYTAPETYTYSNDERLFTEWIVNLNGPNAYNSLSNPWITLSTDRALTFTAGDIINTYYPFYEVTDTIFIRAAYRTSPPSSCLAENTLITLADGSQKLVQDLTGEENLLVWNLFTGTFDTAPILCIDSEPLALNEVINLYFSDGTNVKVISEHGFYDLNANKYVYLGKNASQYIGHWFLKQDIENDESCNAEVQLTDVIIQEEYTTAWSPVTYGHLCYFVNGMLSMPGGIKGLFNIFEVEEETLKYNEELYIKDIETYGLYTYEEFSNILPVTEELFKAVNGKYLKVAIGKGLIDLDTLAEYIDRYSRLFD